MRSPLTFIAINALLSSSHATAIPPQVSEGLLTATSTRAIATQPTTLVTAIKTTPTTPAADNTEFTLEKRK